MKKIGLLIILWSCLTASGQNVTLNSGDVFTYNFSSLTFTGTSQLLPFATCSVDFDTDPLTVGESFKIEMFENNPLEIPFFTLTTTGRPPFFISGITVRRNDPIIHWQDLQGAVRFTMLAGSVNFHELGFGTQIGNDAYYSTFVVPEPQGFALAVLAAALGLCWHRRLSGLGAHQLLVRRANIVDQRGRRQRMSIQRHRLDDPP